MSTKCVVFLCLISIVYAGRQQNLTFRLETDEHNAIKCVNPEKFFWKEDSAVKVYINTGYINKHDCFYAENPQKKLILSDFTQHHEKIYVADVRKILLNEITCHFWFNRNLSIKPIDVMDGISYTKITCKIEILIKYIKSMKVFINEVELNMIDADSDEVDGQATYYYQPNELVNIKCKKPEKVLNKLRYYFASRYNYSCSDRVNYLEFEAVLKAEDSGSFVDCIFGDTGPTILRVRLIKSDYEDVNVVRVNGLVFRGSSYSYLSGVPSVTCGGEAAVISQGTSGDGTATCDILGKNTTIILYVRTTCNDITVKGLSDGKIVFQDCCNDNNYNRMVYEYSDDELIELNCTNGITNALFNWTLNGNLQTNETEGSDSIQVFRRRMLDIYDSSNITCEPEKVITSIEFRYVPKTSQTGTTEDSSNPSNTANNNDDLPEDAGFWAKYKNHVAGGGLSLILLLILLCLVVVFVKRRKHKASPSTDISYANLEHTNQTNRLPRRQNEQIYSNDHACNDGEYAVPVDNMKDDTYSVPYKPKLEELYAKPTPKNQRNDPTENVTYAEIGFAAKNNAVNKKVLADTESPYAEIRTVKQDIYGKVKPKNERSDERNEEYNHTYVNTKSEEYAEPAYCQVGFKNK